MEATFTKTVRFLPGYNKRAEGYGVGTMRILFVLRGPLGAVQWMIGTEWCPASANYPQSMAKTRPTGWDLGYHSPKALYEGQSHMGDCEVLDGAPCYYDGSGLNADLLIEHFIVGGEDYVWRALAAFYENTFNDAPWPDFDAIAKASA